ncbi:MAG: hypothetical protein IPG05_15845 [Gemmatimonadetes bacterium]|jgi:hypothetical protein|nr:hypothetical protein [Gemmatimonadota bacterium]
MTRRPKHHEPDDLDGSPEDDQAGLPSLFEECIADRTLSRRFVLPALLAVIT